MAQEEKIAAEASRVLSEMYNRLGTWRLVAGIVGYSPALCWKVAMGETKSKKVERALGLRPKRIRLAADVTEEQKDALQTWAKYHFGGWTELCREMAECLLAEDGSVSMTFSWHKYHIFDGGDDG